MRNAEICLILHAHLLMDTQELGHVSAIAEELAARLQEVATDYGAVISGTTVSVSNKSRDTRQIMNQAMEFLNQLEELP